MADEIILKYGVDTSGLKDAQKEVQKVTQLTEELHTEVKATFSDKALDEAVSKLHEQGQTMDALILRYGDANKALKAMQKELTTMAALGQRGTKEFQELAAATAELSDTIGDTRGEIKKLASDTRVFDTMVQGARGITAAFSVATGLTAALGKENEDLQKAILKVQGAMAALQGVQELANLATEKGGILTQAYGVALKGVELISKTFGISMQASWALATGGLTILVAGVTALISYLNEATSASERLAQAEKERQQEFGSKISEQVAQLDELDKRQENDFKKAKLRGEDLVKLEKLQLNERLALITQLAYEVKYNRETNAIDEQTYGKLSQRLEKERLDTLLRLRNDNANKSVQIKKEQRQKEAEIETQQFDFPKPEEQSLEVKGLTIKPDEVKIEKVPEMQIDLPTPDLGGELAAQKFITEFSDTLNAIAPTMTAFQQLGQAIFSRETQALEDEKERQLAIVGDNAEKREQVEKKFAIRRAEIERQQAISDKAFATFNAVINLASAISKTIGENGFPAAIPFIALAAAAGAAQIAAIAAAPLPSIPKFEKGGAVALMGGEIRRDSSIIGHSHRQGGVLIEAEGGEYITNKHAAKQYSDELKAANEFRLEYLILHKYVAPALKAAQLASAESYDDRLLRKTIKETSRENAHYIGKSVSKAVSETAYFKARYGV